MIKTSCNSVYFGSSQRSLHRYHWNILNGWSGNCFERHWERERESERETSLLCKLCILRLSVNFEKKNFLCLSYFCSAAKLRKVFHISLWKLKIMERKNWNDYTLTSTYYEWKLKLSVYEEHESGIWFDMKKTRQEILKTNETEAKQNKKGF